MEPAQQSSSSSSAPAAVPVPAPALPAAAEAGPSALTIEAPAQQGEVQVFQPADASNAPTPPPDTFFDHNIADVQAHHASVLARSRKLNDAPLLTAKHRDAAVAEREKKKADKWPTTTIRVKFSDGTQIQRVFPSTSPIQPVYAFVRESLSPSTRSQEFTLYQPPGAMFPESPVAAPAAAKPHPNPAMKARIVQPAGGRTSSLQGGTGGTESLAQLGLVPQSVLLIKWAEADLNASGAPAPLTEELRALAAPLPAPQTKEPEKPALGKKLTGAVGDVKMPKWLQKGLMKKK